jgi:hypothetical protein
MIASRAAKERDAMGDMGGRYDVAIAGGGIAGALAACAAARTGARTLLVERLGHVGGTLVSCLVGPMMTFHCKDEQIIRGLPGELVERLVGEGWSPGHMADSSGYTHSVTPFDSEGMKLTLETMVLDSGAEILYDTCIYGARAEGGEVEEVLAAARSGALRLRSRVFVDATGDAALSAFAGFPIARPEAYQPATMVFKMAGVDIPAIKAYMRARPEEFPRIAGKAGIADSAPRLALCGFVETLKKAKARGEYSIERDDLLFFESNVPGEVVVNTTRVFVRDPLDPEDYSRLALEGRRQARELAAFLKARVPGFAAARLVASGEEIGIRNSRQIEGEYVLSDDDLLLSRRMPDAIAHSAYPIDVHSSTGGGTDSRFLPDGCYYDIPYRCLIPRGSRNLLVAGRCVSATFAAQASIRLSPSAGAMGQAAGTAASIAARRGLPVAAIDTGELRNELRNQGAWLPPRP